MGRHAAGDPRSGREGDQLEDLTVEPLRTLANALPTQGGRCHRPDGPAGNLAHLEGLTMTFSIGQRMTLLKIDECLAMSHRYELEIRKALEPEAVGYEKRYTRTAVVRQRGKRKEFFLDLASDDILLEGWNLPFRTDTECGGIWAGNACYSLVGEP